MKKRTVTRVLCGILCSLMVVSACLIGTSPVSSASTLTDATVKKYEEQIADLQKEQKEIQARLNKLRKESASMQTLKAELDTYLETTARKMEAANTLVAELDADIAEKNEAISVNTASYDKMYQKFLDMMVMTYEEGDASYIGLILGADSLGDFLSRLERVSSMLDYNKSVMDNLEKTGKALEEDKKILEGARALQEATLAELAEDEKEYQAQCDKVIEEMKALSKNQSAAQAELAKNQKAENELDKQLEEYLKELQRKNQAALEAGSWHWPIPLSADQRCSSPYGWRILYGVWDYHRGWDIACWLGTDIEAAKGGTVVIAQYHNSYGNYIVIDHGGGISTVYAHCSKLLVKVGDKVKKGDHIAEVGTTGNSTGYHLHFEFRKDGKYTDPFEFIKEPPITVGASRYNKW